MPRIYSNYDPSDLEAIQAMAASLGFTLSSFQKYCVMLYLNREESVRSNLVSMPGLIAAMKITLQQLEPDSVFMISSLFSPEIWSNLSASDKRTLAHQLSAFVDQHPDAFTVHRHVRGSVKLYRKL